MREMTTQEVQHVCLEIMKDIHDFCDKNDIKYSLSGGSLLGAIRHNGFIPWDDDLDIQMSRPDYERFIHTYHSENGYRLFAYDLKDQEKQVHVRIGRVCEMNKTYVDQSAFPWIEGDTGIWVDIMPVDGAPHGRGEMEEHLNLLKKEDRKVDLWRLGKAPFSIIYRKKSLREKLGFVIRKVKGRFIDDSPFRRYVQMMKKYDYDSSDYFLASIHYEMREWQPKENMAGYELHEFEDTKLYIMKGYINNLKSLYGNDYMQLPPKEKRHTHNYYKYYWRFG